jgi:CHASE2 domain-containing sensor protein
MKEIFMGEDGKPSGRRIIGTLFFVAGIASGIYAMAIPGGWDKFIPMAAFLFVGLFLWGMVTMQNVQEIAKIAKGEK